MANSITASTSSPFTGLLLQDVNYNVSAAWAGAGSTATTPSIYFANVGYPEVGEFIVQLYCTALTNSSASQGVYNYVGLQESLDNVNWNAVGVFTSSLLICKDNGSAATPATTAQVLLTPSAKPYLRAIATTVAGGATTGGITGSFGLQTLF